MTVDRAILLATCQAGIIILTATITFYVVERKLTEFPRCAEPRIGEKLREVNQHKDRTECYYELKTKGRPVIGRKEVIWKN